MEQDAQHVAKAALMGQMNPYTVAHVPFHTHNGADSPNIFAPSTTYVGHVSSTIASYTLPRGWSVTLSAGTYTVTHHLGTTNYVVNATFDYNDITVLVAPGVQISENYFTIRWYSVTTGNLFNSGYNFILTVVGNQTNKPVQLVPYNE